MDRWAEHELASWGRFTQVSECCRPENRTEVVDALNDRDGKPVLAFGLGRSYGDVALLEGGRVVLTERLDHFLSFDRETGWLRCEAGVSLEEIIKVFAPRGYFPPVVPGTSFVTVAGALANDIHGKNHHIDGTFADHVRRVEILTASGEIVTCDADTEPELFWATVGGLGLTGFILAMDVRLVPIESQYISMESIRIRNLEQFFEISKKSNNFTHTVSWIDCSKTGRSLGRGIFMRGRWASRGPSFDVVHKLRHLADPLLDIPVEGSNHLLNRATVSLFNEAFYRKQLKSRSKTREHYEPFFFPLDAVRRWNRLYGPRGLLQYQLVVPPDPDHRAIRLAMEEITRSKMASFLAVIKEFGDQVHGGLSFPIPGVTLALDFPNFGKPLLQLFDRLDRIVLDAGGRLYLGKDARLGKEEFRIMYPEWEKWKAVRDKWDPEGMYQSDLGRRMGLCGGAL
ncbi:MAG: FAD-binding oxidoreductase [Proteobacteria bacterium]|jgi:decaprenylphospho-beta-D-ribofuranose 2-oxidase|nr:FAD-binding oxidoreductase [Pseudomonadota bacterium]